MNTIVRPQRHFALQKGWINDPNGLVWFKGQYHLYFQCNPYSNEWDKMHWGHAVSQDLVHWKECGLALFPDQPYEDYQRGGCFSGSVVEYEGRIYAFYAAVAMQDEKIIPTVCMAYSEDGYTFVKPKDNPIIAECPCESRDFRDPKVIFYKDRWQMVVGGSSGDAADLKSHGRIYLYHSLDLYHWTYDGILYEAQDGEGTMFECPDLFKIDGQWVITASPMNRTDFRPTIYMTGILNFKNCLFCREYFGTLDYGPYYYASQVYYDKYNRPVSIAWLGGWEWMPWIHDHGPSEKNGYRGIMSFPRLVGMGKDRKLQMIPYTEKETESLSGKENCNELKHGIQTAKNMICRAAGELMPADAEHTVWHLQGTLTRKKSTSEVSFIFSDGDDHRIRITLDFLFGNLITDFSESDQWTRNGIRIYKADIENEEEILFDVMRDGNVIEIYLFDGKYNVTTLFYPTDGKVQMAVHTKGAGVKIRYPEQKTKGFT